MAFPLASSRFPNRSRPRRRSRPRPLVSGLVIEKAVIDRTNRIDTARAQRGRGRERRRGRLGKRRTRTKTQHCGYRLPHLLRPLTSLRAGGKGWSLRLRSPLTSSPLTSAASRRQRLEPSLTFTPLTSHLSPSPISPRLFSLAIFQSTHH